MFFTLSLYNSYSIIIPAYNEEDRIAKTIIDLEENIPEIKEIIVVFDGSDNTAEIAAGSGKKVSVLKFERRLGKGGAIIEGFKVASGDVICYIDADGSSPWYEVKRICSMVSEELQAVVGSRWMMTSRVIRHEPLFNRIASRMFHYTVFALLGIRMKDTQCGLKAFQQDLAKALSQRVKITNRTFDVALLYHIHRMGINPLEVGIEWRHDDNTRMPILKVIPMMFMTIIGLRLRHTDNVGGKMKKKLDDLYEEFEFF